MLGRTLRKGLSISASEKPALLSAGGYSTVAGITVSPARALAASAVYSATSLIAQTIASLPIRILERNDESRVPQKPVQARVLWDRPNPFQTTTSFIETAVMSVLLWGNAYVAPRYRNSGEAFELWPLDPDRVESIEPVEAPGGTVSLRYRVTGWETVTNSPGKPAGMIHLTDLTIPGRIKGLSRIEALAELVGMSLSAQEHAARFLGDGVHMSGTIETANALNREQATDLYNAFMKMHSGPSKAGRVGVLTGGAKFNALTIPPAELQFLEQMKYSDAKIAGIYRVPPHMIGDVERSTSWGTGIEEQTIQFVQHTLLPLIRKVEEAFEATLLQGTNYQVRFVTTGLLRGNMAARQAFYQALWGLGAISGDEIRRFEDLPPIPGGRGGEFYRPLNMAPLGSDVPLKDRAALLLLSQLALGAGDA